MNHQISPLHIEKRRLTPHNRVGKSRPLHPKHPGIGIKSPILLQKTIMGKLMAHHLLMGHNNMQAVRSQAAPLHIIPYNLVGRPVKSRLILPAAQIEILIKILVRKLLLSSVLSGGILGKDRVVRVNICQHHIQVPPDIPQKLLIARCLKHGHHGIVHHRVVIACRPLRVLSILIPVNAFSQILPGPLPQTPGKLLLPRKKPRSLQKSRRDPPPVIRSMKTALPNKLKSLSHHRQIFPPKTFYLRQISRIIQLQKPVSPKQPLKTKRRICP